MKAQPSLGPLFTYKGTPGHKERGGTSEQAARAMSDRVEKLQSMVLRELYHRGKMSTDQTAEALSELPGSVRPRFSELKLAGLVEKTRERVANTSGHSATVWQLTDAGLSEIQKQEGGN